LNHSYPRFFSTPTLLPAVEICKRWQHLKGKTRQKPSQQEEGGNFRQNLVMIPDKKGWLNTKAGLN